VRMRPPSLTHLDGRPPDLAAMTITAHRLKGRLARGRPEGGDVSGDGELPRPRATSRLSAIRPSPERTPAKIDQPMRGWPDRRTPVTAHDRSLTMLGAVRKPRGSFRTGPKSPSRCWTSPKTLPALFGPKNQHVRVDRIDATRSQCRSRRSTESGPTRRRVSTWPARWRFPMAQSADQDRSLPLM
jgi:hypothetical protein